MWDPAYPVYIQHIAIASIRWSRTTHPQLYLFLYSVALNEQWWCWVVIPEPNRCFRLDTHSGVTHASFLILTLNHIMFIYICPTTIERCDMGILYVRQSCVYSEDSKGDKPATANTIIYIQQIKCWAVQKGARSNSVHTVRASLTYLVCFCAFNTTHKTPEQYASACICQHQLLLALFFPTNKYAQGCPCCSCRYQEVQ